jgi:hypothetical protein
MVVWMGVGVWMFVWKFVCVLCVCGRAGGCWGVGGGGVGSDHSTPYAGLLGQIRRFGSVTSGEHQAHMLRGQLAAAWAPRAGKTTPHYPYPREGYRRLS